MAERAYTADEQAMIDLWQRHTQAEFELKDADAAIATMTDDPMLVHVPSGTGATGKEALRKFYAEVFIPNTPGDFATEVISRTIDKQRIVEEFIMRCTHDRHMVWFAPGIEATGRKLEVPTIGIIEFEGGKMASEHIYWDQATVLVQLGLLDPEKLPVMGGDQCRRLIDRDAPVNELIERFGE